MVNCERDLQRYTLFSNFAQLRMRRRGPAGFLRVILGQLKKSHKNMLDKELLTNTVEQAITDTDLFLVEVNVTPDNKVTVVIDAAEGVDIDQCVKLTRAIEEKFDRDVEDYELEVGSAGVTSPFKVREQYEMNIGNPVEILTRDGKKMHATLHSVSDDFKSITVTTPEKVKEEGAKRPKLVDVEKSIDIENIKSICYEIKF